MKKELEISAPISLARDILIQMQRKIINGKPSSPTNQKNQQKLVKK